MASKYKALRVPIALLHQKVYSTAHRLDKWTPLDLNPKPATDASRVISRRVTPYTPNLPTVIHPFYRGDQEVVGRLFDHIPYLRKFFYLQDEVKDTVVCRNCGVVCKDGIERSEHVDCYHPISMALLELVADGVCVICEKHIVRQTVNLEYDGAPVCSDDCLYLWDRMNPDNFTAALARARQEIAGHKKEGWVERVYGGR